MSTRTAWTTMPAVAQAVSNGDYGTVLRTARVAAGLNLGAAAALAGCSPSTLSRMETKRNRHWDVRELRRLAEVFGIPAHLFGLSRSTADTDADSLSEGVDEDGGDPMRRRDLIATTAAAAAGALVLPLDQTIPKGMADTIEDVLFGQGRVSVPPIPGSQLAAQLAAARADFGATRYTQLARRLPRLLAQAIAGYETAAVDEAPLASGRLAQAYNVATRLLIKLHDGMAWATADRAVQAARSGNDPMVMAEARRSAAIVMRRTKHRDGAQRVLLDAAQSLKADTDLPDAAHTALYGQLLAAASYTAAVRDDRETAWTLLDEADNAARRLVSGTKTNQFGTLDLAVYKISVSRMLGDYGSAVNYARLVNPARILSPERRARYWEDTALALHGRGRPQASFQALLAAERDTPQEVRFRPWAQQLTRDLLTPSHSLPGIREFASRIGLA